MTYLLLIIATLFNLAAQFLLKKAVSSVKIDLPNAHSFFLIFTNLYVWLGGITYGLSFLVYIYALSRGELGKIAPISQSLTIIGIMLISVFILHETFTVYRGIGILLLILGVLFISR